MTTSSTSKFDSTGWSGATGEAWARAHAQQESMLQPFCDLLIDAASPRPGDAVLDIGCGCGAVTFALAARVRRAVGVDISAAVLARARELAAQASVDNVTFIEGDAERAELWRDFDHVVSRAGVMFFDDPVAAFRNIASSVRDEGKLSFVCWRTPDVNEFVAIPFGVVARHVALPAPNRGTPGPFAFADPEIVTGILRASGWVEIACTAVARPLVVGGGGDAAQAADFFIDQMSAPLSTATPETLESIRSELRAELARHETSRGIVLENTGYLVTATRPRTGRQSR